MDKDLIIKRLFDELVHMYTEVGSRTDQAILMAVTSVTDEHVLSEWRYNQHGEHDSNYREYERKAHAAISDLKRKR